MTGPSHRCVSRAIDEAVEAFEAARGLEGRADLEAFLPPPGHPFHLAVLCELVRVDLEYGYAENRPNCLEDYERRFPELFRDRRLVREIAFEDFRLRREAGESPSATEYRDRYGVESLDPPATEPDPAPPTLEPTPEPSTREQAGKPASRHPRPTATSTASLVAASVVILAALAVGLIARRRGIERVQAIDSLDRLTAQVGEAEFLLLARDAPAREIDEGIALCRRAVDAYGARTDPHWLDRPPASPLAETDRARLRRRMGELLGLWARALARRAEVSTDRRAGRIAEAEGLIALAEASYGPAGGSRELRWQSAALARLAGRESEADRLVAEAEAMPSRDVHERLALVSSYLDRGMDREALARAEEVSRLDPLNPSAWLIRGHCLARLAHLERADPCFSIGIELRPGSVWAHLDRGRVALDRRDFGRALADFDRALELSPDLPEALLDRGLARLKGGDAPGAIADLDRLMGRPDAPTRALFIRGRAHEIRGDLAAAGADRREGLARLPGDEASWIMRGLNRLPTDPAGALQDYRAARRLNPRSLEAFRGEAGVLSETLGRAEDAVKILDEALAHHPQSVPTLAARAVLLARLGRREEAHESTAAALALDDSAETLFKTACIFSLTSGKGPGDAGEALRLLALSIRKDGTRLGRIDSDPDLAPLRDRAEFRRLRDALQVVCTPIDRPK